MLLVFQPPHLEHEVAEVCNGDPCTSKDPQQHRHSCQSDAGQLRLIVTPYKQHDAGSRQAEVYDVPAVIGEPEGGGRGPRDKL